MASENTGFDQFPKLKSEYQLEYAKAERLMRCIEEQISTVLSNNSITLGVPIESRVKSWVSIEEKISRKSYALESVTDLNDLVGIRLILLFRGDRDRLSDIIKDHFDIVSHEDAGAKLGEAQFGYQSHHYVVRLKSEWLKVPSYADLGGISVEIQARTVAQHIWAAASHKLQYKREDSVPIPLRRTINRVSALLEIVDLEFERVLSERDAYLSQQSEGNDSDRQLNVDLVDIIATKILPQANRDPNDDDLDEVLGDLLKFEIKTTKQLENIIIKHFDAIMKEDKRLVRSNLYATEDSDRIARGVYFTFAGLIRQALMEEFGEEEVRKVLWSDDWAEDDFAL